MEAEEIREYCLSKKAVTEGFPFDNETLVFKIGGKMFLLVSLEKHPATFSAKADPEWSEELRENYPQISGAYHMNKTHWNTIILDGSLDDSLVKDWIRDSYNLIFNALPKKTQAEMRARHD